MSKDVVSKINKQIRRIAGLYNIKDRVLIAELSSSCFDEYLLHLESGKSEKESYHAAIESAENTMRSIAEEKQGTKQCNFSLISSLIVFAYAFVMFFVGQFVPDALYSFGVMYPLLLLLAIGIVVYACITHRERSAVDYIVLAILFAAVMAIAIQDFIYFYRARTGNYYYSLYYSFPGILRFNTHWLVSVEPLKYELADTIVLFDPTLLVSVVCLIISITEIVYRKRKMKR